MFKRLINPARLYSTSGSTSGSTTSKQPSKLRQMMSEYGLFGFATYSGISLLSYSSWVLVIHSGVNVDPIITSFNSLYSNVFPPTLPTAPDSVEQNPSEESLKKTSKEEWTTVLLVALAMHELCLPLRAGLTIWATPRLSRYLKSVYK